MIENCSFVYKNKRFSTERILRILREELPVRDQQESIKWLKDKLNLDDNEVEVVQGLIDNRSLGRLQSDGKILLSSLASDSVAYHEAFHRVFRMYLSPQQRVSLIQDFKKRSNYKSLLDQYTEYSGEENKIEEYLADQFSDYVLNPSGFKSPDLTLFQKLIKFLKSIVGIKDIQEVYSNILKREYTGTPKYNPYQADKIEIQNSEFTVDQKQEIVDSFTQRLLSNVLNQGVDVTEFLDQGNKNIDQMVQYTKDQLVDDMIESNSDADQIQSILDDLESGQSEIWKGVKRNIEFIGLVVTDVPEDKTDGALDEDTNASREFNVSFEVDPKSSMSVRLRLILASLTDGVSNNYKFKKPLSWTKAFNTVATRMSGVPTSEFMNELKLLDVGYKQDLINILDKNFMFRNEFISEMSKTINEFYIYKFNKGEAYLFNANSNTRIDKIVRDWKNNIIKNTQQSFGKRDWKEELERLILTRSELKILNHLGIQPDSRITDLSIAWTMVTAMDKSGFNINLANPFESLDIEGYVKQLATKQADYEEQMDLMVRLGENKLYTLGLNTQQSILLNNLAYAQSKFNPDTPINIKIDIIRQYAPFAVSEFNLTQIGDKYIINNKWLERILNGEKLKLVVPYLSENSSDERTVDQLDEPDLMSLHISGALSGVTMSMKHSDRSTFFAYTFGDPLYTTKDASSESNLLSKLTSDILRIIESEVKVDKFIKENKVSIQHISKKSLKDGFSALVDNPENPTVADIAKINLVVKQKFEDYINKAIDLGLISSDLSSTPGLNKEQIASYGQTRLALASAFVNETSSHLYESMLFSGDLRSFKNADDLFKRLAPQSSTGTMMVNDDITNQYIRQELDKTYQVYNPLTKTLETINTSNLPKDGYFRSVTLAERENYKSKLLDLATSNGEPVISKLTGKQESSLFMAYEYNFLNDKQFREANTDAQIEKKIRLYEKKYSEANENDGQTYTTLPTFKQDRIRQGKWNDGFELVYRIEMALSQYKTLEEAKDIEIEFMGHKFKPFDLSNESFGKRTLGRKTIKLEPIHSLKSQYAGYSIPEELEADVQYAFNTIIKTSDHVLLPSSIIGTNLQLMNYSMLKNGINFHPMGSANKVGGVDPKIAAKNNLANLKDRKYLQDITDRGLDFYTKEGIFNHEAIEENLDILSYISPWEFRKDQVKIGNKTKSEIKGSTQSLKILLSNLIINSEERFPGAEELVNNYKRLVHDIVLGNRNEFFEDIGFVDGEFNSLDDLKRVILDSSQVKNSSDNVKNSIENFFNDPELGIESVPLKNKIENVLYSLITNNIISFDRPGSSYPQAAPTGYEAYGSRNIESSNDEALKFYSFEFNELGEVTKVNPAEIIIPLPMDWIKPLMKWSKTTNLIEAITKLNNEINLRPDDFQVKGLRIPNQQLSSNGIFQIKQFHLPTMQNYVLVPTEIVVSMGSDFDVDKLNLYWSNIADKLFNSNPDNTLDNQLLDLEKQILLHPRNAHNLLLPVTDEIFVKGTYQSLVQQGVIKPQSPEMINAVLPQTNIEKSIIFVKGKQMVGPGALTITGNAAKQADKFGQINTIFQSNDGIVETRLRFKNLEQNFNVDNSITSNGGQISETLSQLLSISVDNVKNPVAELQNINMQTIGIVSYLIERGVSEIEIINFINQPIIKYYLKAQKANESLFNKEAKKELKKKHLISKVLSDLGILKFTILNNEVDNIDSIAGTDAIALSMGEIKIPNDWVFENKGFVGASSLEQLYVLGYFLDLIDQARAYGTFNSTQNSDTKGLKDKQALDEANLTLSAVQQKNPLIPTSTLNRINTEGIISPFYQFGRRSYNMYNRFYAIENSIFGNALTNLKNNYADYEKGSNKDRVRQAITNDFQLFLIHNFVLNNEFDRLMKGKESLPNKINDLKLKLPGNLVLQAFLPMINHTTDTLNKDNISSLRLFEKEIQALDEQAMSVSLEEIANSDLELYKDLVKFLMYQTGLNTSVFNYGKILPIGLDSQRSTNPEYMYVYQDMVQDGMREMKKRVKNKEQAKELFTQFRLLFDLNNPRFIKENHLSGHPIKRGYNGKDTIYTNTDNRLVSLLGNAYQKRYSLDYIGQKIVSQPELPILETENNSIVEDISNSIIEEVDTIFNKHSNLSAIGSKEQYITYVNSIFPDSKVKDIVYHASQQNIQIFDLSKKVNKKEKGIFFFKKKKSAQLWRDAEFQEDNTKQGYILPVLLNLKNPSVIDFDNKSAWNMQDYVNNNTSGDGVIANNVDEMFVGRDTQYVAFQSDQIHILGSKSDEQSFRNWLENSSKKLGSKSKEFIDSEFQYYGATYSIKVVDEKAVEVLDYKGKKNKEQRILDAYNTNPNIDQQNNKYFRNFVPDNNPEVRAKLEKYELFPGVFANAGQKEAIDLIEEFLNSDEEVFTLNGRGGTGKTTIIKNIMERHKGSWLGITYSHKAKKVLGRSIGKNKVKTVHSALAIKLNEETGEFTPDEFAREQGNIPIKYAQYVIVDEASMIDTEMFQEILSLKEPETKVIFMGDKAQLPPIGESEDSPVFNIKNQYTLKEKMRQAATSPIIGIGTTIADNIESKNPKLIAITDRTNKKDTISGSEVIFTSNEQSVIESFAADFLKNNNNPDFVKAIVFNNEKHNAPQSVKNINAKIRRQLFGDRTNEQFIVGEILTAYDTYSRDIGADEDQIPVHNSEDFIITGISYLNNYTDYVTAYSNRLGNRRFDYNYDLVVLDLIDSDGQPIIGYSVPVLANSSRQQYEKDLAELWKTDKQLAFSLKNAFANLQYGYAITSHKAQGSTYTNTYVFEDNILGNTNAGDILTKNKSLYVAVSRPTTKLVMVSNRNLDFIIEPKVELDQSTNSILFQEEQVSGYRARTVKNASAELTNLAGKVMDNNVSQINKSEPNIKLDTIEQEIVDNFNSYFPQYNWMNNSEKQIMARLVQSGELNLTCNF